MGWQIIKQPDNKYCVFSSIVDHMIAHDLDRQEVIDLYKSEFGKKGELNVSEVLDQLDRGEKPYLQFTMTFEEMIKWINEVHESDIKWID